MKELANFAHSGAAKQGGVTCIGRPQKYLNTRVYIGTPTAIWSQFPMLPKRIDDGTSLEDETL